MKLIRTSVVFAVICAFLLIQTSEVCYAGTTILNWVRYADLTREVPNTEAAILSVVTDATITRSTANTASQLESELAGVDVFLISESGESGSYAGEGTLFASLLQDFVTSGGVVIQCEGGYYGVDVLGDAGLMTRTYEGMTHTGLGTVELPGHQLASDLGATVQMANATEYWSSTDPSVDIVVSYSSSDYGVLMSKTIGSGWVIGIGYDYYDRNADADQIIGNAVNAVIPAPGAILLGSIGVGLVGWLRRRRAF